MFTAAQVLGLLTILDGIFALGGKLVKLAKQKEPRLNIDDPGPLDELEASRAAAQKRIAESAASDANELDPKP